MKRFWVGCILLTVASMAVADSKVTPREFAIEVAAHRRMTGQSDTWFDRGDYPRIVELLRYMNNMYPTDYDTATNLGWMLGNVERYDEELATYVTFRKGNPSEPDRALPEAQFYYMKHAYAKVPPLLEPTLAEKPHPNVFRILASSYEKLNLFKDSKRVWDAYLVLAPTDGAAKANLARVMKKMSGQIPTTPAPKTKP